MYVHLYFNDMHGETIRIIVREKTNKMQQLDVYYQHFLRRPNRVLLHVVCCAVSA